MGYEHTLTWRSRIDASCSPDSRIGIENTDSLLFSVSKGVVNGFVSGECSPLPLAAAVSSGVELRSLSDESDEEESSSESTLKIKKKKISLKEMIGNVIYKRTFHLQWLVHTLVLREGKTCFQMSCLSKTSHYFPHLNQCIDSRNRQSHPSPLNP